MITILFVKNPCSRKKFFIHAQLCLSDYQTFHTHIWLPDESFPFSRFHPLISFKFFNANAHAFMQALQFQISHPSIVPFRAKKPPLHCCFSHPLFYRESGGKKTLLQRACVIANFFGFPTYTFERVTTDNKYAIFMSSSPLFRWLPLSIFFPS